MAIHDVRGGEREQQQQESQQKGTQQKCVNRARKGITITTTAHGQETQDSLHLP